jgi:hypothetical protein
MSQSPENPHAGQGAVLLDIGGDVGALVVTMPAAMVGQEVEIWPPGQVLAHRHQAHGHEHTHPHTHQHGHPQHVAVVSRPVGAGQVPSLVFPDLVEGSYGLTLKGTDEVRVSVDIRGGEVTTADWPL